MPTGKILIVDDHKSVLTSLEILLQDEFEEIITLSNPNQLMHILAVKAIDVVILDMNFSAGRNNCNEGIFWLNKILEYNATLAVVLLTAYGDVELAVKAIKQGATDFILKPWDNSKLIATIKTALQLRKSKQKIVRLENDKKNLARELNNHKTQMIGRSKPMLELQKVIKKVAKTDANVLITGENGTGKELIAREIHQQSKRANEALITVDMGALTETLFESELFGHEKGAFTDAKEERAGRFEVASGGTLFLDEIGNLPLPLQAKLLSVLQTRHVVRLGSNHSKAVDIRLICATNKNLPQMVANGEFREDLLYRINTIQIEAAPLRKRGGDIAILAEFFLRQYAKKYNKDALTFSEKTITKLMDYSWPGNVRELQHTIEKAVILTDNRELMADEFLFQQYHKLNNDYTALSIEEVEKKMIVDAVERHSRNMSAVAKELGVTRQTLYNKLKKYGL